MCYSKERLQELYKESRYRHGIYEKREKYVESEESEYTEINYDLIRKLKSKKDENLYRLCKESCKQ